MSDANPRGVRRMLQLRQFPLFETIDLDELATIAENLVEITIPAGTQIVAAGDRVHGVHLILAGRIESQPHGQTWSAHQVFGALEVLAHRAAAHSAVAASDVQALYLPAGEVGEVLEDNFGVLLATVRELAGRLLAAAPPPARTCGCAAGPLGLVERLIVLRQLLPFTSARLQALATLAHASEEVQWRAGAVIAHAGEPASGGLIIIDGGARALRDDGEQLFEPGAAIGHLETLAGLPHRATIETTQPVRALRSGAPAIFDVLEDHTDVALAMTATFAGALLDATAQLN
ncbi:MAG TPA: cyclic nucleotide-binding domain-containing protein [Kofleriaceae bacterium]|nr:cyclic nucleotide-binding domain-containing protein [Kofleriaceae bacterium]